MLKQNLRKWQKRMSFKWSREKETLCRFGHAAFDGTGNAQSGPYGNDGGFGGFSDFGGSGGFHGGTYRSNNGNGYQEFHFEGGDMGDIFENFFGGGFKKSGFRGGSGQNGTLIMAFTAISGKMEDLEIGNLIKQKEMIFMQIYR